MKQNTLFIGAAVVALVALAGMLFFVGGSSHSLNLTNDLAQLGSSTSATTSTTSTTTTSTTVTKTVTSAGNTSTNTSQQTSSGTSGTTGTHTSNEPTGIPYISKIEPASATPGTQVVIYGTNFSHTKNYITFGTASGRHHADGTADNVVATVGSSDGKSLVFTIPTSGPSGILCDAQNHCVAVAAMRITSGTYPITVINNVGPSNTVRYQVMGS